MLALTGGRGHLRVVNDRDTCGAAKRREHVADVDVVERHPQRIARRRAQQRFRRRGAGALAQLLDRRTRPGGLDPRANGLIERGDFRGRLAVARIVFRRQLILTARRLELILLFEITRLVEVGARRGKHRPLQRNLVVGVVWRRLRRRPEVRDRLIQVAGLHRRVPITEGLTGRAPRCQHDGRDEDAQMEKAAPHIALRFVTSPQKSCREMHHVQSHDPDSRIV